MTSRWSVATGQRGVSDAGVAAGPVLGVRAMDATDPALDTPPVAREGSFEVSGDRPHAVCMPSEDAGMQARLEALYHFAYGLSHELNNPLANIAARAQALWTDERDPQRQRTLATIAQQAFRAYEMIADLMQVARPPAPQPQWLDLSRFARQFWEQCRLRAEAQGTRLLLDCPPDLPPAWLDEAQLGMLLGALVSNALEAVGQGGTVTIRIEPPAGPLARWRLMVLDDGPGIPPEHLPHLFDPFFSGREAGRGLGLGLCKVWRIAQVNGGTVRVDSAPQRGTAVVVELPATAPATAATQAGIPCGSSGA